MGMLAGIGKGAAKAAKAANDWQRAKEAMIKAGRKDAPATGSTMRPDVEAVKRGLKSNKPGMTQEELIGWSGYYELKREVEEKTIQEAKSKSRARKR